LQPQLPQRNKSGKLKPNLQSTQRQSYSHEDDSVPISASETGENLPYGFCVLRSSFGEELVLKGEKIKSQKRKTRFNEVRVAPYIVESRLVVGLEEPCILSVFEFLTFSVSFILRRISSVLLYLERSAFHISTTCYSILYCNNVGLIF
jgi:hypothetical protein